MYPRTRGMSLPSILGSRRGRPPDSDAASLLAVLQPGAIVPTSTRAHALSTLLGLVDSRGG